jgi:hypothetical protein
MKRFLLVPVLGALALAVSAPAQAQWGRPDSRQGYGYSSEARRAAYDRGFREGRTEGEKDGRSRDPFRYEDEGDYRKGDIGYHRNYGSVDLYRRTFREGFAAGYTEGYRRYAPNGYGGYGPYDGGRYGNNGRYGDNGRPGAYGDRAYGYPQDRNDRVISPFDIGARDGYEKGREDARDNNRLDPRRHKWYREGDREYNSRYGSRDRYKDEYRRGFTLGYERGYREARR